MLPIIHLISAFIAGILLPFAFAPYNNWALVLCSLTVLLFVLEKSSAKNAAIKAFVFGLGFFGVGTSWVYISIHTFGDTDPSIAVFITFLFVATLAAFVGLQGFLLKKFYKNNIFTYALIGFPTSWIIIEWFRSWFLTGFPWLYIGYTQTSGPLKGFAPIIGVYGVSFLLALSSGIIFLLLKVVTSSINSKQKNLTIYTYIPLILLLCAIWYPAKFLSNINWTNPGEHEISVALLQGNIAPNDKFVLNDPISTIDNIYGAMTRENLDQNIIIWPENALPMPLQDATSYLSLLQTLAIDNNTTLLLGMPEETKDKKHYYNSLVKIGKNNEIYQKKKLVPFGDYLPFDSLLRGLINFFDLPMSSFVSGNTGNVLDASISTIMPLICYEIAFPETIIKNLGKQTADVLVTISEDGWFGKSLGPYQHLQIAQMRAIETGRYVLRATTSGISAIITPKGIIVSESPQFTPYVLRGHYYNMYGNTPLIRLGILPLIFFSMVLFLVLPLFKSAALILKKNR